MKLTKSHLKKLINEEVQVLKKQQALKEQYKAILEQVDNMSYEELKQFEGMSKEKIKEALGKWIGKKLRKGFDTLSSPLQTLKSDPDYQEAEKEDAEEQAKKIADQAEAAKNKTEQQLRKVINNYTEYAVKKGFEDPFGAMEEVLKNILQKITATGQVDPSIPGQELKPRMHRPFAGYHVGEQKITKN